MIPKSQLASFPRNFITIIDNTDDEESIRKELAAYTNRAQFMGCDPYPHYRRVRYLNLFEVLILLTQYYYCL